MSEASALQAALHQSPLADPRPQAPLLSVGTTSRKSRRAAG
jgi:hypothetical protein